MIIKICWYRDDAMQVSTEEEGGWWLEIIEALISEGEVTSLFDHWEFSDQIVWWWWSLHCGFKILEFLCSMIVHWGEWMKVSQEGLEAWGWPYPRCSWCFLMSHGHSPLSSLLLSLFSSLLSPYQNQSDGRHHSIKGAQVGEGRDYRGLLSGLESSANTEEDLEEAKLFLFRLW